MTRFQPFHDLAASQYEALKRDIEARGIVNPIILDEHGVVIDGHQRRRIAAELHIEAPTVVVSDLTDDEKMSLAIALNTFRRHLSGVERSQAIQKMANLGMSVRRIAAATGVPKSTVQDDLSGVRTRTPEAVPTVVTGADGRRYPATKPQAPLVNVEPETGEITGGEGRKEPEVSDDAPATDEGAGLPRKGASDEDVTNGPAPSAPNLRDAAHPDDSYRARMSREFAAVRNGLLLLDPDRMREVSDFDRRDDVEALTADLREWCERVEAVFVNRPRMEMVK